MRERFRIDGLVVDALTCLEYILFKYILCRHSIRPFYSLSLSLSHSHTFLVFPASEYMDVQHKFMVGPGELYSKI